MEAKRKAEEEAGEEEEERELSRAAEARQAVQAKASNSPKTKSPTGMRLRRRCAWSHP